MATTGRVSLNAGAVSLAAAHGITSRVANTWYPSLLRSPRLLVPMELEVLMVRNAGQRWAETAMKTPPAADHASGDGGGTTVTGESLKPDLFAELNQPRARGAYLQWYLPRAFTSGVADDPTNTAQFPPIPDRWLVVRLSAGGSALRRRVRGWVLEAGGEPPVVADLATWKETGVKPAVQNPITALGHGDLAWAGYFDNVNGRLGFADNTLDQDQVAGPLAYLACGWFSDPLLDPLGDQSIESWYDFALKLQHLGWVIDEGDVPEAYKQAQARIAAGEGAGLPSTMDAGLAATIGSRAQFLGDVTADRLAPWWPRACVLHGAVIGITWPGNSDTVEAGGPPAAGAVAVALGNTMAETMAAIVSRANGKPDEAQIVEALQLGVIKELDQPDGRAQLDVQVHTESFTSISGGDPVPEPVNIAPSGPPQAPPANPPAPGPGIFAQHNAASQGSIQKSGSFFQGKSAAQHGVATVEPRVGSTSTVRAETNLVHGRLQEVLGVIGAGSVVPPTHPGGVITAMRSQPRFYLPEDPVLLLQGGKRAFTHDSTVKTENGMVVCRAVSVTELSWRMPGSNLRYSVRGEDILESGVENGSVPPECELLLRETALLDVGSAPAMAATVAAVQPSAPFDHATAQSNIMVEQTAWYALRTPGIDHGPLLANSGLTGVLPAYYAVAPAARPWTPLELQWSGEFLPSPNGEKEWDMGEIDFVLDPKAQIPAAGTGIPVAGRSTVTGGASQALAAAVANAIQQAASVSGTGPVPLAMHEAHYSQIAQSLAAKYSGYKLRPATGGSASPDPALTDIATALSQMDVLSCGLNGLLTQLRGGLPGDGHTLPPDGNVPTPFLALRAGFLRIKRLRLVDGFGQFLDLCGSSAAADASGLLISQPLAVDQHPDLAGLPPRYSAPTRAWLRYMSADQPEVEADYQTSPVCAFLMPNHLEGSLEFFNADGSGAGSLIPADDGSVSWQVAPGLATSAGQDPGSTLTNPYAQGLARSLVGWGLADAGQEREPALSALLRTIDSTLWTIDPFGHQGDEHLSLLLGHPVCVMRALLRLDVNDKVFTPDNTVAAVPVRLGNLTQWVDGLLGYFVNDDYTTLYVADAAAPDMARQVGPQKGFLQQINLVPPYYDTFADDLTSTGGTSPANHPYLDRSGLIWVRPNQMVNLTLLVEPLTSVHATMGLTPRKEIGMRREWVNAGLAAIAPTFRFGPVLVDPKHIRMPLPVDLNGTWVWDYRAAAANWAEDAATNATDDALLGDDPPTASEGWLKLEPAKPAGGAQ